MKISRIKKIQKYWIFRNFSWPESLPEFAQFNVIYGWNGSGKTALSTLLGHLQNKKAIHDGEVVFEVDGKKLILGSAIPTKNVPPVRVFNRDFLADTLKAIGNNEIAPIYFLGKKNIEKQREVEALKKNLTAASEEAAAADAAKQNAANQLERFKSEHAKYIKEALRGSAVHANYDKNSFVGTIEKIKNATLRPHALSEQEKDAMWAQKSMQLKEPIAEVKVELPKLEVLHSQVSALLGKTVASDVIDELASDPVVGKWVLDGLSLHKGTHESDVCRFCGKEFSLERREKLDAHFNDAFTKLQNEIARTGEEIEGQKQSIKKIALPNKSDFHENLIAEVAPKLVAASKACGSVNQALHGLIEDLDRKKSAPFKSLAVVAKNRELNSLVDSLSTAIEEINAIIGKHNATNSNLKDRIRQAYKALEEDLVLNELPSYEKIAGKAEQAATAYKIKSKTPEQIKAEIRTSEEAILEHRRPANELTAEICAYLGHAELKFELAGNGYVLLRNGQPASNLSEGERTAITFLYFLKSLQDKGFDANNGIVAIDDPVSSLDETALFSAFGYMKERTKNCHQLFVFTHNFSFFRQIQNWLQHSNRKEHSQFYSLYTVDHNGERTAMLAEIDPLLFNYNSEYHFLFKKVHDAAYSEHSDARLEQFYAIPNIARRLLESFFSYRLPNNKGNLSQKIASIKCDQTATAGIIEFLNAYSHALGIADPGHNLSRLAETKKVIKKVLHLMRDLDPQHYNGMEMLVMTKQQRSLAARKSALELMRLGGTEPQLEDIPRQRPDST